MSTEAGELIEAMTKLEPRLRGEVNRPDAEAVRTSATADPLRIATSMLGSYLAAGALLFLPAAAGLLYRNLIRRFAQMEAPPTAKAMDTWFVEI